MSYRLKSLGLISLTLLLSAGIPILSSGSYFTPQLALAQTSEEKEAEAERLFQEGVQLYQQGKVREALEIFQKAVVIFREIGNRSNEAWSLIGIGLMYDNLGQPNQALKHYEQALTIQREIKDRSGEGTTLSNIGLVYDSLGKYEQALDYLQQALVIHKEVGNRPMESTTLHNIGLVYNHLGKYEQALNYYQQALAIRKEVGAAEGTRSARSGEGKTLNNIGYVLEAQNQPELAIIFLKQSVNTFELIRKDIQGLPTEDQEAYTKTVEDTYRKLADLLLSQNRIYEAQRVLDLLKVQEINDYLRGTRGNENTQQGVPLSPTEQQIWTNYQDLVNKAVAYGKELSELRKIKPQDRTPAQNQRILELKNAESFLVEDFKNFINSPEVLTAIQKLGSGTDEEDIKQRLGELDDLTDKLGKLNAAIIYPFILEDRIELIITTPYSPPTRRTVQVSQKELNETILKFRDALKNPNSDPKPLANQLYQWLVQPLENDLKAANVKTIIYAPDGILRYIPLAALYDGKQWLIERYSVNHITAASLKTIDTQPQGELQILAGAVTQAYRLQIGGETFDLAALPYAGKEIATLADMIPDTVQLLDTTFSIQQTQIMMEGSTIIHFATHTAIVVGSPEESFILFGNGERATLDQVENWKFNNVDLVVLSACETAVGGNLGDGMVKGLP